jgi:opacity protein-like surface antigen
MPRALLALVKSILAVAAALTPASVPAVATVAAIGGTVAVTAGCGQADDDDGDEEDGGGGNNDDDGDDNGGGY